MKIKEIKRYNKEYNGALYPRADLIYGEAPLIGYVTLTENTMIYRKVNGMLCLVGTGFSELKTGDEITPILFTDKYGNHVLKSIVVG